MNRIRKAVKAVKSRGLYPDIPAVLSSHQPELIVDGRKTLLFASNNYLGMLNDERVAEAAVRYARTWSIGSGGARLHSGNLDIHARLERDIADFKNREAALTFVSGYAVNEGCIPALVDVLDVSALQALRVRRRKSPDTVVFSDQYNHASVIAGIRLSGAAKEIYRHNDMDDLQERLRAHSKRRRKFIVTDGVFSMDGDIVRLPQLMELAREHGALVYLDDAHATGVLGSHGRGTEDHFGMEGQVDFVMGTFTKAFGGVGGYIAATQEVIDYLKITSRNFIFSAPIAPPVVGGLLESIRIVKEEPWRRRQLQDNARYLREGLQAAGFDTMASETQIIPVLVGDEGKAIQASHFLFHHGIFVPVIRWPAVPKGMARLRFTVMVSHVKEQMDYLLHIMEKARMKNLIPSCAS